MLRNSRLYILLSMMLISVTMLAQDSLPIVEIKADRTIIYPQRMELTGEETLMDVLQMVPDLMIAGYQDVISTYNLRCPYQRRQPTHPQPDEGEGHRQDTGV